ncbi:MarR family winged helix-turn-helix transcriptional regulator [Streptomyces xiamenensis]|uniref:Regulator family n=1 Tax=Streptomyces xiamenensis TaxID=408015 RepID=A0A0F7FW48_9ACTN|nr:hypothetical protein [Streptomyces xiamenensis]AKG44184.1 regulator family [Streptomyces xiamenensis]
MSDLRKYPTEELAAQPIGYWSTAVSRAVLGRIRAELSTEGLTQPHWWTLNHAAGDPGGWERGPLARKLLPFADPGTEFGPVFDDLVARGWLTESPGFTLTGAGEAGRLRARALLGAAHEQIHRGVPADEYAAAVNVLRRMAGNLGGVSDLP